jgi:O-antigen ligase
MVLIVATDAQPTAALRRLLSRVGFVLLPTSLLLINYYPGLGQGFDAFGMREYTGVTTSKNVLGNLAFIISLGVLWQVLRLVRDRGEPHRARRLLAQCTLLAFAVKLLFLAHCATANASVILGAGLMLAASLPIIRHRPAAVHALVLAILLGGGLIVLLGGRAAITKALGRKPDLTGRTEIWKILIPMVPNPIGGAGFETFWVGPRVRTIYTAVGGLEMTNESHNGYIDVYLNLGWLGLVLIAVILVQGYRKTVWVFRRDSTLGALLVAYVVTMVTYNISEAAFRMLGLEWFFLLLSVVVASRVAQDQRRSPRRLAKSAFVAEANWPPLLEVTGQQADPAPSSNFALGLSLKRATH